jgi:hypothetical protein
VGRRTLFLALGELPARVYQRRPQFWDRVVLAAGWSLLYLLVSSAGMWTAGDAIASEVALAFPAEWRLVLAALVFVLGVWKPVAGYAAFLVAVAYPLYLISIYVMALALAVLILMLPVMAVYSEQGVLFLALLVFLTPALARVHLAPLVPLLAGLWWEGAGSCIGGGLAALWLKVAAGMAGHPVDLWQMNGWSMRTGAIYERFHASNSLQTVVRVLEPLGVRIGRVPLAQGIELGAAVSYPAPAGIYTLYNLLQVLVWAAAGWTVSAALDRLQTRGVGRGGGWGLSALSLGPGLLLIWAGYVAIPSWLSIEGPGWFEPRWLLAHVLWVGLVAWGLDGLLRALHRPVSPDGWSTRSSVPGRRRAAPAQGQDGAFAEEADEKHVERHGPVNRHVPVARQPARPLGRIRRQRTGPRRASVEDQASDIMIELD